MGRHGGHQKPSPPPDVNNPPGQYPPQSHYPPQAPYPPPGQYPPQGSYVPQGQYGASYGGYQQDRYGQPQYGPPPQGPGGPQYQQGPGPQDASAPPQRKKRRRVRHVLIISGAVIIAVILLVAVVTAVSGKNKPAATPTAQSYPSVASLLAAMAAHGATCSNADIKSGGSVTGEVNPFADCSGASSGDTAITIFTGHPDAVAYANSMISLNAPLGPVAEVVGPNWVVNTSPAFASKVIKAVGGQLITAPAATPAAAAPTATPTPSSLTEPVGGTFTDTTTNNTTGATSVYNVTLDKVDQNAALGPYETLTNPADHAAGAEFTIAGTSGQTSDDANSDAVAIGTDGQDYTPSFVTITDGTNFDSGEFNVASGQTVNGWVSFELPPNVTIASVQWSPGFSGQAATWTVGS